MTHIITDENLESVIEELDISLETVKQLYTDQELQEMIAEANKLSQPQYYFRNWIWQTYCESEAESQEAKRNNSRYYE